MLFGNFTPSASFQVDDVRITSYPPPQDLAADRVRHGAAKLKPVGLCTRIMSPGESFSNDAVSDHMLHPSASRNDHTPE